MTDQEIRIAIAEVCGWKVEKLNSGWISIKERLPANGQRIIGKWKPNP